MKKQNESIDQYAKRMLLSIQHLLTPELLLKLQDPAYCKDTVGRMGRGNQYPVLVIEGGDYFCGTGQNRFYQKECDRINVHGNTYRITAQWYKEHEQGFEYWMSSIGAEVAGSEATMAAQPTLEIEVVEPEVVVVEKERVSLGHLESINALLATLSKIHRRHFNELWQASNVVYPGGKPKDYVIQGGISYAMFELLQSLKNVMSHDKSAPHYDDINNLSIKLMDTINNQQSKTIIK